jgi:hypothetical protein
MQENIQIFIILSPMSQRTGGNFRATPVRAGGVKFNGK